MRRRFKQGNFRPYRPASPKHHAYQIALNVAAGGLPVLFRLVAVDLEILPHLKRLQVAGNASARGFQPCFLQGPDLEEGVGVVFAEQPLLLDGGEPAFYYFLPLSMALAGFKIQSNGGASRIN